MSRKESARIANRARQDALSGEERAQVASRAARAFWDALTAEERSRIMTERAARRRKRQRRTTAARRAPARRANVAGAPLEGGAEQLQAGGATDQPVEGPAGSSTAEMLKRKGIL